MVITRQQIVDELLELDWDSVVARFAGQDKDEIYDELIHDGFNGREAYPLSNHIYEEIYGKSP